MFLEVGVDAEKFQTPKYCACAVFLAIGAMPMHLYIQCSNDYQGQASGRVTYTHASEIKVQDLSAMNVDSCVVPALPE